MILSKGSEDIKRRSKCGEAERRRKMEKRRQGRESDLFCISCVLCNRKEREEEAATLSLSLSLSLSGGFLPPPKRRELCVVSDSQWRSRSAYALFFSPLRHIFTFCFCNESVKRPRAVLFCYGFNKAHLLCGWIFSDPAHWECFVLALK